LAGTAGYFPEPRLRELLTLAFKNNRDLGMAALSVDEALARFGIARAGRLPSAEAGLSLEASGGPERRASESWSAEVTAPSFTLDFFGKYKNLSLSAREAWLASRDAYEAYRITLTAAVAAAYIQERALAQKEDLARRTIKSWRDAELFMRQRVVSGQASLLELEQARGQAEAAEAALLSLTAERKRAENSLELLTGAYGAAQLPQALSLFAWEPGPITGPIASEALLKRPDVSAAERELVAAHHDIGAARAEFFPSFSLAGALGFMSGELGSLFAYGGSAWSLTPAVTIPVFQGGRSRSRLAEAYAARDRLVLAYEKAIQTAFKEAADALRPREDLKSLIVAREKRLNTQRRVLELAGAQYQNGAASYLDVLDAQRSVFEAENSLLDARADWLINSVNLFAALGGGLSYDISPAPPRMEAGGEESGGE
jgi:NodT family efflux transporter outer membrane factor (OMF) lipoprotein